MGIHIDKDAAWQQLNRAIEWARSDRPVPEHWVAVTRVMDQAAYKTYTPALGTALLARAVDPSADPLSIKSGYADDTYSLRSLCHGVLVPAAKDYGFSLRSSGREPINNQPFFRYNHMSEIDKVLKAARSQLDLLRHSLTELASQSQDDALAGLAAFLRVRFEATDQALKLDLPELEVPLDQLISLIDSFLGENVDRPKRTQALAAAAFDLIFEKVGSRRLNDPSRDFPGDVQAYHGSQPIMSAEVRAKLVQESDVRGYVEALRRAGISRGFIVVLHPTHEPLDRRHLAQWAWSVHRVVLTIIEATSELAQSVLAWADKPVEKLLTEFPERVERRLVEIEAADSSRMRWAELTTAAAIDLSPSKI
ncbi:restriction endonuclease, SacI family [Micromonospora purpureochromogenes]|uniref:restriction endonuclease, SacI family n=1 Tax=Micromonospora purpureochromogenes TaxID=47872 RepID=UPI00331E707C